MNRYYRYLCLLLVLATLGSSDVLAQRRRAAETQPVQEVLKAVPVIVDGEAQRVAAFENPDEWIRHDLWVVTEFDSDGDGKQIGRAHV